MRIAISFFAMIFLAACRDGHFESARSYEQQALWELKSIDTKACSEPGCFEIKIQIQAILSGRPLKRKSFQYSFEPSSKLFWKTGSTNADGLASLSQKVYLKTQLPRERVEMRLHIADRAFQKFQREFVFEFDGKNLSQRLSKNLVGIPNFQITDLRAKVLKRNPIQFSEEKVRWSLEGVILDSHDGSPVRYPNVEWRYGTKEWNSASLVNGRFQIFFEDSHRPLDNEPLSRRLLQFRFDQNSEVLEASIQFTLDASRADPLVFQNFNLDSQRPSSAPSILPEILSVLRQEPFSKLTWTSQLEPRWSRIDELRLRLLLKRSLIDREDAREYPGLHVQIKIEPVPNEKLSCLIHGEAAQWNGILSQQEISIVLTSLFERPSCVDSNFYWKIQIESLNAPRVEPSVFWLDSNSRNVFKSEDHLEDFSQTKDVQNAMVYRLPNDFSALLQDPLTEKSSPQIEKLLKQHLKQDRELAKFTSGREKILQTFALRTWRWTNIRSSNSSETRSDFIRLVDDEDYLRRRWTTQIQGDAHACLALIFEVHPRISGSPFFEGEKRKIRVFCSEESHRIANWTEELDVFTALHEELESANRDKIVRGYWINRLSDNLSESQIEEFDLLRHRELYSWGSVIESLNTNLFGAK